MNEIFVFTQISNNNVTNLNTSESKVLPNIDIIASVIYFIFGVTSIIGNVIVSVAMYKAHLLKSGGYLILVHYSITDITTAILLVFYMPLAIFLQETLGPSFVYGFVLTFAETSSKLFILLMAFTRFYSIMFPLKARGLMGLHWYKKTINIIWITSIIFCIPLWVGKSNCFDPTTYHWIFNDVSLKWVTIYGAIFNISVTLVILTAYPICFLKLIKVGNIWNDQGSVNRRQSVSLQNSHKERNFLYLFCINGIIFVLYWLPAYLVGLWNVDIPNVALLEEFMRCIEVSYNPFLYFCINSNIRCAVKNLCCHKNLPHLVNNSRQRLTSSYRSDNKY